MIYALRYFTYSNYLAILARSAGPSVRATGENRHDGLHDRALSPHRRCSWHVRGARHRVPHDDQAGRRRCPRRDRGRRGRGRGRESRRHAAAPRRARRARGPAMTGQIRALLLVEAVTYVIAALAHFGVLTTGFEHRQAGTAESLIAAVLLAGLALTWTASASAGTIGLAAQGSALAGTLVGVVTIAIGVGPRTVP